MRTRGRMVAQEQKPRRSFAREMGEWIITLALAVGLALAVHVWVGGLVTVSGESMEPTLLNTDKVLMGKVEYYFRLPRRGDIVIVKYPGVEDNIIKRVIANAGETVSVKDGSVYIDGKKLDEPYIKEAIREDFPEQTIRPDEVFVMGDNRNFSMDSRNSGVGAIPIEHVLGRAYAVVWPAGRWKQLTAYPGSLLAGQ